MAPASGETALGAALGKRAPKTTRGRRILKRREPQIVEDAKSALLLRGNKCAFDVQVFLRDLHKLRAPLATLFMQSHPEHPFEDTSKLESLCTKTDSTLFAFGSSSKKRPFRVIFGRLFDGRLLDMLEYGVRDFKPLSSFNASRREAVAGSKPLVVFQGAAFETNEQLKRTKSLLLDFFGGAQPEKVLLQGLDHVVVVSTFDSSHVASGVGADADPPVSLRRFRVKHQKSGAKVPRVELEEIGPRFTLALDRSKGPDKDHWKQALKVPKAAKPTKVKNVSKDDMGKRVGRLHLGRQDFDQIHTVHHGEAKRRKLAATAASASTKTEAAGAPQPDAGP